MQKVKEVKIRAPRVFECDVTISGPLDLPFDFWPAHIQDAILYNLQRISDRHNINLEIVAAVYKKDVDIPEDVPGHHYLHIIAREVIATWH